MSRTAANTSAIRTLREIFRMGSSRRLKNSDSSAAEARRSARIRLLVTAQECLSESARQKPLLAKRASKRTFGPPSILLKGAAEGPNRQLSREPQARAPAKGSPEWDS